MMEHDDFFDDHPESRQLFDVLRDRIARLGPVELRVSKSQVAFCRGKPFAFAWMPAKYLNGCTAGITRRAGRRSWSRIRGASRTTWSCLDRRTLTPK